MRKNQALDILPTLAANKATPTIRMALPALAIVGFGLVTVTGPLPTATPYITDLIAFVTAVLPVVLYFTKLPKPQQ